MIGGQGVFRLTLHGYVCLTTMPSTSKQTIALALALLASFALAFTGFGFFWVGIPGACLLLAGAYAITAFAAARWAALPAVLVAVGLGLLPLAGIMVQFRDASGSHLLPAAILSVWCGAALWGAWTGADRTFPFRRIAFLFIAASILHATAAAAALAFSLGDSLSHFETGVTGQMPMVHGAASVLSEPMMTALSTGKLRLDRAAQWGFFAANSMNWGVMIALAVQTSGVLRPSKRIPA